MGMFPTGATKIIPLLAPSSISFNISLSDAIEPKISNRYVVWLEKNNNTWNIEGYDVITNSLKTLVHDDQNVTDTSLYGDMLSWIENNEVFYCRLK